MASRQTYSTAAENSSQSSSQSLSSARSSVSSTLASTSIEALSIMANASNSTYIGVHLDNSETIIHPNKIIRGK
jgi:hypothetical protein